MRENSTKAFGDFDDGYSGIEHCLGVRDQNNRHGYCSQDLWHRLHI